MERDDNVNKYGLPEMFKTLLWSYRFAEVDPEEHKDEIIVNTVNLGSLKHWKWLVNNYGKAQIKEVLEGRLETEVNRESRSLAQLIFGVEKWRHVRRSTN